MDKLKYCEIICNYLNNLKGYIEDYEIKNLLWCVFGLEDVKDNLITSEDVYKLSCDISCDKGNDFYEDLYFIYRRLNNGQNTSK